MKYRVDPKWLRYWPPPQFAFAPPLIINPLTRDPHEVMKELRLEDPDAHALLSEHIVLPESNTDKSREERKS